MTEFVAHAHMTTADTGAIVTAHADCSCGWVGVRHQTIDIGSVLGAWKLAVADRNVHKLDHQNRE